MRSRWLTLLLLVLLGVLASPVLAPLDESIHESWLRSRPPQPTVTPLVLGVVLDDESLRQFGWPVPRDVSLESCRRLRRAGARVIGLDIIFEDVGPDRQADASLARLLLEPDVVVATALGDDLQPLPLFARAARSGFLAQDVRGEQVLLRAGDQYAWPVELVAQFYGCSPAEVLTRLPRGKMLWVAPDRAAKKRCYQASVADILQLSDHQLETLVGQPFIAVVGLEEHLNLRLPTVANLITDGFLRKASPWEASMLVFGAALCGVIAGSLRIWVGAIALTCGLLALRAAACHAILLPVSSLVCAMLTAWLLTLILRSSDRTDEINAALERLAQPPPC